MIPVRVTINNSIEELKSKKEVDYSEGMRKSNCGLCKFFLEQENKCKKVKGEIHADMWCKLFEHK